MNHLPHSVVRGLSQSGRRLAILLNRAAQSFDRYPFNSPWVWQIVRRWSLPLWFALISTSGVLATIAIKPVLFFDARLYLMATRAWLAGLDPWTVELSGYYFAAPPLTMLPLVPFALLPDPMDWLVLGALVVAGAIATLRILKLPWLWLLFPPVVHGLISGNVQLLLIPLVLGRGAWLAPLLKVYAALPLVFLSKWRALAVFAVVLVVSAPLLPWANYIDNFAQINGNLSEQARYGLSGPLIPALIPIGLLCLWFVGRQAAAWFIVPALWPAQQWYYATLVMPIRSDLVGAIVAIPVAGSAYLALVVMGTLRFLGMVRRREALRSNEAPPAAGSRDAE